MLWVSISPAAGCSTSSCLCLFSIHISMSSRDSSSCHLFVLNQENWPQFLFQLTFSLSSGNENRNRTNPVHTNRKFFIYVCFKTGTINISKSLLCHHIWPSCTDRHHLWQEPVSREVFRKPYEQYSSQNFSKTIWNKPKQSCGEQGMYFIVIFCMWLYKSCGVGHWGTLLSAVLSISQGKYNLGFFSCCFSMRPKTFLWGISFPTGKWKVNILYKMSTVLWCSLMYFLLFKCHCTTSIMGQICPRGVDGDRVIGVLG